MNDRNRIAPDVAERNRTEGEGGYTYNAFIPAGTTGVGFTVAALRVGDHAHLDIDSGPIAERKPGEWPEVNRGGAGHLTLRWHEWLVLREILAASDRVRIAEVERPTVDQMEVHIP